MAVYTHVEKNALVAFLKQYNIGTLTDFRGIQQGVENTNYHLHTSHGRFILTLFERRTDKSDLPFFMEAMAHFNAKGIAAPEPIKNRHGETIGPLADRPAVIISFLDGNPNMIPDAQACRMMGEMVAELHIAANGFERTRPNPLSFHGWQELAEACAEKGDVYRPGLNDIIADELSLLAQSRLDTDHVTNDFALPRGLVHTDLFPDNVFFKGVQISGIIDYYFACTDFFAYDLAVTLNAWCFQNGWQHQNAQALIEGYQSKRPLNVEEETALPLFLRGAALRFLLTRLYDWIHQIDGAVVKVKDPLDYLETLTYHRTNTTTFEDII
ncbi:MAG: homoserine kinase [Pseudomonadota bacterium]